MGACCAERERGKYKFYQLISVGDTSLDELKCKLDENKLIPTEVLKLSGRTVIIVEAVERLNLLLRNFEDYNFLIFDTGKLLAILDPLSNRYSIETVHLFGIVDERHDTVSEQIDEYHYKKDFEKLFELIREEKLQITDFKVLTDSKTIKLYRSGLLYTDVSFDDLMSFLGEILEYR